MFFKNLRIGHRLGLSFGVIALLLAVIASLTFIRIGSLSRDIDVTNNYLYPKAVLANKIKDKVTEAVIDMRNALLLKDPARAAAELDDIEAGARIIVAAIDKLEHAADSERDRELLARLKTIRGNFVVVRTRFAALVKEGKTEQAQAFLFSDVNPAQQAYYAGLDQLIAHADSLMQASGKLSGDYAGSTRNSILMLTVLALLASVAVAWYATRTITAPLANAVAIARKVADGDLSSDIVVDSADETGQLLSSLRSMNDSLLHIVSQVRDGTGSIAGVSQEISAGNTDLSGRTETQASSLEQTAAAMEELTATVKKNAESADQANLTAANAAKVAAAGGVVVDQVVDTMLSINQSSRKIADIISVIDGIAFQTNILALNAAVEAARAGEQGRGFAVVASEVRNLAQRSASAAKEIKTLIEDSVQKVDAGTRLVEHAGSTMHQVVDSVQSVAVTIAEISVASREQSAGIEQVNQAIAQMDQVTQKNAALVEEATIASRSLQEHAGNLAQVVSTFKLRPAQQQATGRTGHPRKARQLTAIAGV